MNISRVKGVRLNILLAESIRRLKLNDITKEIRYIDSFSIINGSKVTAKGYYQADLNFENPELYLSLQKKLHINVNYVQTKDSMMWKAEYNDGLQIFEGFGRTPEQALTRSIVLGVFKSDSISSSEFKELIGQSIVDEEEEDSQD